MKNRIQWLLAFFLIGSCQGIVPPKAVGTAPLHPQTPRPQAARPRPSQPEVPGVIIRACLGSTCYERRSMGDKQVIRYTPGTDIISRHDFLKGLADPNNNNLRLIFNHSIAELPTPAGSDNGYMVWAPVINKDTKGLPFYLVAMAKSGFSKDVSDKFSAQFKHCDPHPIIDIDEYRKRFVKMFAYEKDAVFAERDLDDPTPDLKYGAVIFKGGINKGPNPSEIMVSPCPIDKDLKADADKDLTDIYSFTKRLKNKPSEIARLHSFWLAVGKAALLMFDGIRVRDLAGQEKNRLLLNTHGYTISYLHFRVETESADYTHYKEHAGDAGEKMLDDKGSRDYYEKTFPTIH